MRTPAKWSGPRWTSRVSVDDSCDVCEQKHNGAAVLIDSGNAGEYGPDCVCLGCVMRMLDVLDPVGGAFLEAAVLWRERARSLGWLAAWRLLLRPAMREQMPCGGRRTFNSRRSIDRHLERALARAQRAHVEPLQ